MSTPTQPTKLFNRNYLLQWQGQTVSRFGNQAFTIALLFWIKHATGSAGLMGLIQMLSTLPAVFLGPIAGAFADRYSRWKVIIFMDLLRGVAVLVLAALMFVTPDATTPILIGFCLLSMLLSITSSFSNSAIQASIPDLVPANRVTSANSLGQLSVQLSVFLGQGLGGTLYRVLGAPLLVLFNGLSFLFAVFSEAFVVIPQVIPEQSKDVREQFRQFGRDILEGMRYVVKRHGLREAVIISSVLNFFTAPIIILLPFYIEDVLKVPSDWYGYLLAVTGIGSLFGYLIAGVLHLPGGLRGKLVLTMIVLEAVGYGLLGLIRSQWVALGLGFLGGFSAGYVTVNIMTSLQLTTPSEMRGRVFGLLATISGSLAPVAMGLAGIIADLLNQNIPLIYVSCGAIMTVTTLIAALNADFRRFLAFEAVDAPVPVAEEQVAPAG